MSLVALLTKLTGTLCSNPLLQKISADHQDPFFIVKYITITPPKELFGKCLGQTSQKVQNVKFPIKKSFLENSLPCRNNFIQIVLLSRFLKHI